MIVSFYAALLALLFVALSVRVIVLRGRHGVLIGDAGHEALRRAVRVQGNFAEYVPLALLLLAFAEQRGLAAGWLHAAGIALLLGRSAHALNVSRLDENPRLRAFGVGPTLAVTVLAASYLLLGFLGRAGVS